MIEAIIEKVNLNKPETLITAVNESIGLSVKKGDSVAIVGDPTYSLDGARGKVKAIKDTGYAEVELQNGAVVNCLSNLLIPV